MKAQTTEHTRPTTERPAVPDPNRSSEILDPQKPSIFNAFFDEYVALANDPSPTIEYISPAESMREAPEIIELSRAEVIDQRLSDLQQYMKVAFETNAIEFDYSLLNPGQPVTFESICEALVADGVQKAVIRRQLRQPVHITASDVDPDPKTTAEFESIVYSDAENDAEKAKGFGQLVVGLLQKTPFYHSGPTHIVPQVVETKAASETESQPISQPNKIITGYDSIDKDDELIY